MITNPRVNVLMSTYNCESYLTLSIKSVLSQTYSNFNLIIIDDGSTDNTKEIINKFNDSRIIYIYKDNTGTGDSLNVGLSNSKTELIAIFDSDDIMLPFRLEDQVKMLIKNPSIDIISSWYANFEKRKVKYIVNTETESEKIVKRLSIHNEIVPSGMLFRKNIIMGFGGYRTNFIEDYELMLRIKDKVKFSIVPKVLFLKRIHNKSKTYANIKKRDNLIYAVQKPYYSDIMGSFNLKNNLEENIIKGWREYFYGSRNIARRYWNNNLISNFISSPKIIIAYCTTYFNDNIFVLFKEYKLRFRIRYYIKYFSRQNIMLRKYLNEFINNNSKY